MQVLKNFWKGEFIAVATVALILGFSFVVYQSIRKPSAFENHRYFLHATLSALVLAFVLRSYDIAEIDSCLKFHKEQEAEAMYKDHCEYSGFI
jgi:EamA domain-containing membrane protein RarD